LIMKPVSYQSMPSSVDGGHPNLPMDRVLNASNVMYCEKCGFASTDLATFKKHMIEHMGTRFYCLHCYNVSFSESEFKAHMKEHTTYPFKCPHCGQGYMRRLCLVKHIERLHNKGIAQGPTKPGMIKTPHVPLSSALSGVPTADPSTRQPVVRVTVPTPIAPVVRLDKDEQKAKTLDSNLPNVTNGNTVLSSPLSGLIQHNRALTVSLPEEVTIPAGCLVELVEVKTVNGTKELKLRLVSQQENESVIKDSRMAVCQSAVLGKTLSPKLNHPNTVKSTNMGMCTVNRKQCETKAVNGERPTVAPVNIPKSLSNQISKEKYGLKRNSQGVINLDCHPPNKVSKHIHNPVRERNGGITVTQREAVNHKATPPTVISSRIPNRLTNTLHPENMGACVSQKTVDERKTFLPEHPKGISSVKTSDVKSTPRETSHAVKLQPGSMRLKDNAASKIKKASVGGNQQNLKSASPSLNVHLAAATHLRPSAISGCKDNATPHPSFPVPGAARRALDEPSSSVKTPVVSTHTNSNIPAWTQGGRSTDGDMPEPEGFPVISSVFSLSQQPEDVQGSMQPLVLALRDIVMDKSDSSDSLMGDVIKLTSSTEQEKDASKPEHHAQVDTKSGSFTPLLMEQTSESVKVEEQDKGLLHSLTPIQKDIHVKEEENSATPMDKTKCGHTDLKPSTDEGSISKCGSNVGATPAVDPLLPEPDISSKFLTVSLKRVDERVWKKSKKSLKLRIPKFKPQFPVGSLSDSTVIHPMPLKQDQLVKRPSPNQPVVVLNHPKPRAPVQERADTVADTGTPEVAPKCQILKMRLSKVMGQKYEVMGCTVRVCP
ncbi:uncharacterized protein znf518b, partial [Aulostomus maculatus]